MHRPQFTLRALLVAVLIVAAFFGGMAVQRRLDKPLSHKKVTVAGSGGKIGSTSEMMVLRDGTKWHRDFGGGVGNNRAASKRKHLSRRAPGHPLFTQPLNPR